VVLLEDGASARSRGARPWARLAGTASAGSPVSPQQRRARPEEIAATIRAALAEAGLEPLRVGLVHASANGVPWIDAAEEAALAGVFGTAPRIDRVKLQVGENPCSGALQLALAARALRDEPKLDAVLVNSLGAGGNQIAVVLAAP
jgi:3-oxoacyl-(acyl-carrier-protein) synthase